MSYRVSDLSTKEEIHEDSVWCSVWNNKKDFIITGSVDSFVKVWKIDGSSIKNLSKISGHKLGFYFLFFIFYKSFIS
jgi:WD40 repeat protein